MTWQLIKIIAYEQGLTKMNWDEVQNIDDTSIFIDFVTTPDAKLHILSNAAAAIISGKNITKNMDNT